MSKDKARYKDFSKTEFLFESDAEKAVLNEAAKPKKKKLYKKIITNCIIISFITFGVFYSLNRYQIDKLTASITLSNKEKISSIETMNSSSNKLETVNNNSTKYEIIINKANPINQEDLNNYKIVDVQDNIYTDVKLEEQTYKQYIKLKNTLLERGFYINIRSGYRTFEESEQIYEYYKSKNGLSYAEKYVAKPGVSEHNAGIAFDFIISKDKNAINTDYNSDEYFYLESIAYLYGFIIRYPQGKENITGYEYEPWHFRYVGVNLAKYLKKNNLTLEEYYKTGE